VVKRKVVIIWGMRPKKGDWESGERPGMVGEGEDPGGKGISVYG